MDSLLVTPSSEADLQLLTALFKKMKIKARVLPTASAAKPAAPVEFVPQNQAEANMLDAVLELREVLAGRKKAMSMEEFWKEMDED